MNDRFSIELQMPTEMAAGIFLHKVRAQKAEEQLVILDGVIDHLTRAFDIDLPLGQEEESGKGEERSIPRIKPTNIDGKSAA